MEGSSSLPRRLPSFAAYQLCPAEKRYRHVLAGNSFSFRVHDVLTRIGPFMIPLFIGGQTSFFFFLHFLLRIGSF